ncbi:glycosyltransferase [Mycobacterium triplex]|uniref:Glycosyl transferase family protein n=1 Tax=Mycobacterium triplex TaxID=47839 RepID=A0A024JZX2_9MYCO|nr:glycosyltransferase [Mycobacterium triplex]ORX04741.1 glycosyltransferase [Mycobacterium triplex]CDO89360.1 glycosyl transferase family protein [Mycobacterium triplex]
MKFVLAGYGTRGDVEPFAAIARELRARGHDVRLAVPPWMLGFVESAGLAAVPFGTNPTPLGAVDDVARRVTQILTDWSTGFKTLADGADLLVTGKGEQRVAANVAQYYGIPQAALHFFPGDPAITGGVIGALTRQAEQAQRRDLGLPDVAAPAREPLEIQAYDEVCFPGLAAEWAAQGKRRPFVGALTLALPTDADAEVLSWIAAGTPPIFFGFGGAITLPNPAETLAMITAACAQLGERALVSGVSGVTRSDHVKLVSAVNHAAVFPACRAVVHHGGAGTTAAGLRAGIPTLILWHAADDQPVWAAAITRLGVGSGHEFRSTTTDSLVIGLRSMLEPDRVGWARELAAKMTEPAESVARAADLLEEAAGAGRPA